MTSGPRVTHTPCQSQSADPGHAREPPAADFPPSILVTAPMNPDKILPFKSRLCYIQCRPAHRITPRRVKNQVMRQG